MTSPLTLEEPAALAEEAEQDVGRGAAPGAEGEARAPVTSREPVTPTERGRRVELGWILAGQLSKADLEATTLAHRRAREALEEALPSFSWHLPLVRRREMVRAWRVSPVRLLDGGALEREAAHWDFALVVTEAELIGHFKPFVLGTPSQAINVATLSTSRLDPQASGEVMDEQRRVAVMTQRITALALHLFGHLNDLDHSDGPDTYMHDLQAVGELDGMTRFDAEGVARLEDNLQDVADERVEEAAAYRRGSHLVFHAAALWRGRRSIVNAALEAKPWLFPVLLSKLTTAAVSALLLMVNTAEAWDLGMSQTPTRVIGFSVLTLVGTTLYVMQRQRLLRVRHGRRSEQRVISHAAVTLAVVIGMATMYGLLFGSTLLISQTLFSDRLASAWAASLTVPVRLVHYLTMSAFVAAVGLVVGALGASFEDESYFRHVALVDEET